jgi:hypothetical protein
MSLGSTLPLTETSTKKSKADKQTNTWAATACYWDSFTFYSNELFALTKVCSTLHMSEQVLFQCVIFSLSTNE